MRLIDADKIQYTSIAHLASYPVAPSPCDTVMRAEINAIPTVDAVPVIRCKDCKYNNGGRCSWHGGAGYKWIVDDDDYCSCAERKDGYVTLHHEDIHFIDEDAERAFYESLAERKEE